MRGVASAFGSSFGDLLRCFFDNVRSFHSLGSGGPKIGHEAYSLPAIEEFGTSVIGKPIKVLSGDHQNKPDIGSQLARRWFDVDNVDMVIDFPNSGVALAVQEIARTKKKIAIYSTAATMDLSGKACSPTGFQWTYDNYSNAAGVAQALVKNGLDSWYFLTVD